MVPFREAMRVSAVWVALAALLVVCAACQDEGTIKVHKLTFKGIHAVSASRLEGALATKQSSKLPWGKKAYFERSRFDADLKRIQAFYADRGYPDARVTGVDVKLNKKQDAVDITVSIDEGQPIKVVAIDFVGFDVIPAAHMTTMKKQVPLKVGQARDRQQVVTTHELALNELRDHGYPYAKVAIAENDGASGKEATLTFTADPGKIAHFGPVSIQGNKSVGDNVIQREVAYKPGELYRRSLVQETQRRLYGMELFQFVNDEPIGVDQQPGDVPTQITVAEAKHQRVNFGVGYGTEEKGRVDTEYHDLNFLGGARSAGAHARWSSLDRGVRLDFTQPYFFAPHLSLGGEAQRWYTYTPAYNSTVSGVKATLTHRGSKQTQWSVSIDSEQDTSAITPAVLGDLSLRNSLIALGLDPRTDQQSGTINSLAFDFQRSTADNLLNAHHGYQIALHAEEAGRILPGTYNYYAMSIDARHYLPLGDNLVFASRLQIGNIYPLGNDQFNVPFSKKYFLGGSTSIRGWGIYEVSPLSGSGLPIGGDAMAAISEELRGVISGNFGGVLFLDAGNVWADAFGFDGTLRYAVGPGLRYQTPIGPIRLDFGYQLNPEPGLLVNGSPQTRRWRVHFSIGQAF